MFKIVLIAAGGGLGSVLRYAIAGWGQRLGDGVFPVGTLLVNVLGCFAIGVLNALFTGPLLIRPEYRMALTIGVLGGFTTFSAFGWETFKLTDDGQIRWAAMNIVLSITLGLAAVMAGYRLVEKWLGV